MKKAFARVALIALSGALISFLAPVQSSHAVATTLDESFTGSTLINPTKWVASSTGNTGVHPCLTAATLSQTIALGLGTSITGCSNSPDAAGSGGLVLTTNGAQQTATMLYNSALPTSGGLDIAFYQAQYGGSAADGISFFTKDGSLSDTTTGVAGGGLGYKGLPGGLFGIGFDRYGNWLNTSGSMDSACTNPGQTSYGFAIRGPDTSVGKTGASGYCVLPGGSAGNIGASYFGGGSDTRLQAARPVRIIVDPSTDATPKIRVYMWTSGAPSQDTATAGVSITVDQPNEYKNASTIKFGFSASTGGANDFHAVWGISIAPVAALTTAKMYVVPTSDTIAAGSATPTYRYNIYSNLARTTLLDTTTLSSYVAPSCSTTYTTSTSGGTVLPITCTGGTAALYETVIDAANLTVSMPPRSVSFATTSYSAYYGDTITVAATASQAGGSITYLMRSGGSSCSVDTNTGVVLIFGVGTCAIDGKASAISGSPETTTATPVSISISPRPLTIRAVISPNRITVGGAAPTITNTFTGLVGSDTLTITRNFTGTGGYNSATTPTAVGTYSLATSNPVFTVGNAGNYAMSLYTSNFFIDAAGVVVVAPREDPQTSSITTYSPKSGPVEGGTIVVINGKFIANISAISVDRANLSSSSWKQNSTTVTFTMPAHSAGPVMIQLYNGQSPLLEALAYTYEKAPEPAPVKAAEPTKAPEVAPAPAPETTNSPAPVTFGPIGFSFLKFGITSKQAKLINALTDKSTGIIKSGMSIKLIGYAQNNATNDDIRISLDRAIEVKKALLKKVPNLKVTIVGAGTKQNPACAKYKNKCVQVVTQKA